MGLMILIAATAAGLAVLRGNLPDVLRTAGYWSGAERDPVWFCVAMLGAAPLVAFWSLALLVIRLRRPRPSIRRLARQPGFIACGAAVLGILLGALIAIPYLRDGNGYDEWGLFASFPVGYAVAASWLTLVLNRRWRPVPTLLDRSGRVFGAYWIATFPIFLLILFDIV